jgi:hypothetical protein
VPPAFRCFSTAMIFIFAESGLLHERSPGGKLYSRVVLFVRGGYTITVMMWH